MGIKKILTETLEVLLEIKESLNRLTPDDVANAPSLSVEESEVKKDD